MIETINDLLWGKILVVALIAPGLVFTAVSRFVQFRYFLQMFSIIRQAFHHEAGHLSSFQALALSVVGRVAAGNIAAIAVAISLGGPSLTTAAVARLMRENLCGELHPGVPMLPPGAD